ncbi:E3 ubiquitin-protein ligase orthrus [Thalictrum thalictroides]|uniref:E3 ubiquitin-protein ligase orthrus n=1 Tax=Thalictrum thalictroides TaxID=46969 RepID=A0A7J6X1D8_THATH|nr:E3 ubiquitin-protein ligase orthrus [Thalictrum thalictroides]
MESGSTDSEESQLKRFHLKSVSSAMARSSHSSLNDTHTLGHCLLHFVFGMEHGNLQMHLHPFGSLPTDILNFEHKVQWVDHQPCKHKATGLIPSIVEEEILLWIINLITAQRSDSCPAFFFNHMPSSSSYAPDKGVQYDGVYRIEKCWRKIGKQEHKVCRYLFVRCDNEPAPWSSDEHGDRPRSLPVIEELKAATGVTERKEDPSWDYDEEESCWKWKRPPPLSRKTMDARNPEDRKRAQKAKKNAENLSGRDRLLKGLSCTICRNVMHIPVMAACGHSFCKSCLEGAFSGQIFVRERTCAGRRNLRAQKNVMKCPDALCLTDISDYIKNPQVNRGLMGTIESLQLKAEEEIDEDVSSEESAGTNEQSETVSIDTGKAEKQDDSKVVQNPHEK